MTSRVVLKEPDETASSEPFQYRELILIDGIYRVQIWRKADGQKEFVIVEAETLADAEAFCEARCEPSS